METMDSTTDFRLLKFHVSDLQRLLPTIIPLYAEGKASHQLLSVLTSTKIYLAKELVKANARYTTGNDFIAVSYTWSESLQEVIQLLCDKLEKSNVETSYVWIDII